MPSLGTSTFIKQSCWIVWQNISIAYKTGTLSRKSETNGIDKGLKNILWTLQINIGFFKWGKDFNEVLWSLEENTTLSLIQSKVIIDSAF